MILQECGSTTDSLYFDLFSKLHIYLRLSAHTAKEKAVTLQFITPWQVVVAVLLDKFFQVYQLL